jgi:uncharacterized damage-inducible protein DinB
MKTLVFLFCTALLFGQTKQPPSYWYEGLWQGYEGEWTHVTRQVLALAEAMPEDKYGWRPEPGVRSVSEVYMHIVIANYGLLNVTGPKLPEGLSQSDKAVTKKAEVIEWLTRSFEAVKTERAKVKPAGFARAVKNGAMPATVDGMYLRILVHANEHMGQLIANARAMGVVPPWSAN